MSEWLKSPLNLRVFRWFICTLNLTYHRDFPPNKRTIKSKPRDKRNVLRSTKQTCLSKNTRVESPIIVS